MTIDTHVHLYSKENASDLNWMQPDSKFYRDHNLSDYLANTLSPDEIQGLVFLEVDVKNKDLSIPIKEYCYVIDQFESDKTLKFKKIIPFCPLTVSPNDFIAYIDALKKAKGIALFNKYVSGFRYLLQDKPQNHMSDINLIENLKYLGKNNYAFDLGIDLHGPENYGIWQFDQFIQLLGNFHSDTCPRFIINHMTKPDLTLLPETISLDQVYINWSIRMTLLHDILKTLGKPSYMKISGGFSELPKEIVLSKDVTAIKAFIKPWFKVILDIWGPEYLIWGSDFPVSQFTYNDPENSKFVIPLWKQVTDELFTDFKIDPELINDIYNKNAINAYTTISEEPSS